ncbi:MAG: hypothetical protein IGS03_06460 [Candidatus Sericytochromatia bacterium]|nr:hypothetical protein [Candidatus Sericytochromatia bacterium]
MVVPVVLGATAFDFNTPRNEQARLSRALVLPSPRDKDDTSQVMELEDEPTASNPDRVPFKYPTFVKVRFDKQGALPIFELWMKDNFDQEFKISKERRVDPLDPTTYIEPPPAVNTTQDINVNPLVAGSPPDGRVNNNFAINPITGEVYRNAYWDQGARVIRDANGDTPIDIANFDGDLVGTIKFDGVTGLALAAINTRIAAVSNAIEGMTKVLSVTNSNYDAVIGLIR